MASADKISGSRLLANAAWVTVLWPACKQAEEDYYRESSS
jgi:hypothetical protein